MKKIDTLKTTPETEIATRNTLSFINFIKQRFNKMIIKFAIQEVQKLSPWITRDILEFSNENKNYMKIFEE